MDRKPRKVLIVKLNRLGDTIEFLPTIKTLRENWPGARLTLLTTTIGKELLEDSRLVNEIWVSAIDKVKTLSDFFRLLKVVRKNRFDVAIASSDSSSFVALLFFLASIPVRVGFTNPGLSFLFNKKIPFSKQITHTELNLKIANLFGLPDEWIDASNDISILENEKQELLQKLSRYGIGKTDRFIILHAGAHRPSHRWQIDRYAKVINFLVEKYGIKIVCIGSDVEKQTVSSLKEIANKDSIIDMTGQTTIKQLIYLISLAGLYIGHSSGPLHIAYMVGTPTVSLWGASALKVWGPAREKDIHICIQPDLDCLACEKMVCPKESVECMELITPETVISKIAELNI